MRSIALLCLSAFFIIDSAIAQPSQASKRTWQQDARYQIAVELDTAARQLIGEMKIFYRNHSPDALDRIYLQVPANAFHDEENTAAREMARVNQGGVRFVQRKGYPLTISSVQFLSIGAETEFAIQAFDFHDTILNLRLPKTLLPGDTLALAVQFTKDYARLFERAKTQPPRLDAGLWFPLLCVYDEEGWHAEPFHFMMDSKDVFSEFAEMDVTVRVPSNYVIVGSGELVAGDTGWNEVTLELAGDSSAFRAKQDSLVRARQKTADTRPPRVTRFHAKRRHNFLWSASPRFIRVEKKGAPRFHLFAEGRGAYDWMKNASARLDAVFAFLAGHTGPYPFSELSIVQSANVAAAQPGLMFCEESGYFDLAYASAGLFFPGMVASNGVKSAWMAAGLTMYFGKALNEQQYGKRGYDVQDAQADMNFFERQYPLPSLDQALRNFARLYMDSGQDEPIANEIHEYRDPIGMAANVYLKSEIFYEMLRYVLGDSLFKNVLREYVREFSFQHVNEKDFQAACERVSGQDLNWFFEQWLHGTPVVDYKKGAVRKYQRNDSTWVTEVEVQRQGNGIMPIEVALDLGNAQRLVQRWDGKAKADTLVFETKTKPKAVRVDPEDRVMDRNLLNNGRRRLELKPDLPLMRLIHMPGDAYLVLWKPLLDYNKIDGVRLGLRTSGSYRAFYNNLTLEFMLGAASHELDGKIAYHHPLRRSNLLTRYHVLARKHAGRLEADAHLEFNGSNGIMTSNSRSLEIGFNYSDLLDEAYTYREVRNDTGTARLEEWEDVRQFFSYVNAKLRLGGKNFDVDARTRAEQAWRDMSFTKLAGRVETEYKNFGVSLRTRFNAATALGRDRLPRQDLFHAEGASPRERFMNGVLDTRGGVLASSRRYVEGGGYLRGYAGLPLPAEKFLTANFELGNRGSLRTFAFYDIGKLWPQRDAEAQTRADAGLGFSFLGNKSRLFGGNLALFSNLSARLYFPLWLSDPPLREKQTQWRWYFALGKSL
jgi:hypothetical protein